MNCQLKEKMHKEEKKLRIRGKKQSKPQCFSLPGTAADTSRMLTSFHNGPPTGMSKEQASSGTCESPSQSLVPGVACLSI